MYMHRRRWGNSVMHVLLVVVVLSLKRLFASDKEERMRAPKAPWDISVARNDFISSLRLRLLYLRDRSPRFSQLMSDDCADMAS
jgi:hypothetical protein